METDIFDEDNYFFEGDKTISVIVGIGDNFITRNIQLTDNLLPDDMQERLQDMVDTLMGNN